MEERRFRITAVEACKNDSAVRGGVREAMNSAMALIVENGDGVIRDGLIVSKNDLTGRRALPEIGVVVFISEATPVAATC